jgi:SAM-dependent methyltransferase
MSSELIALARERMRQQNIEADLRVGSAYQTELPDGSVDVIFCMSLIHHLHIPMAVAEMRRILSPDGFIVMEEPICFSRMYAKMRVIFPASDDISECEHPLTKEEFAQVKEGFHVSGMRLFCLPFVPMAQRYLRLKPELPMKSSAFVLRHFHYLEHFATVAVMKLSRWFYARAPHLRSLAGFRDLRD